MDTYEVRLLSISDSICLYKGVDDWPKFYMPENSFKDEAPRALNITISAPGEPLVGMVEETGDFVGVSDPPAEPVSKDKKKK